MFHGWIGLNLKIDLSQGRIIKREGGRQDYEEYLGGKGINARTFWDEVSPDTAPFASENPIIISTGVLTGTMVPSANRAVFTFRSPQTLLHHYSAFGGYWPAEFKHAGYDTLIITGKSPRPVYLWIRDDAVEIRDAGHLWGENTYFTKLSIREELKNSQVQVLSIGIAGENKVFGATVEDGAGASASRCGPGAVMGDKNLKAIAVYGTRDVYLAHPDRLKELCGQIIQRSVPLRKWTAKFPYRLNEQLLRMGFFGNLNETFGDVSDEFRNEIERAGDKSRDLIHKQRVREVSCFNCGIRCKQSFRRPDGGHTIIKCQSWWAFMICLKIIDYDFALHCYQKCEEYGLDALSTARDIAFATELYEQGILKSEDTDGIHLEWKNKEAALDLIGKIAKREGVGNILADGIYEAARQFGRGAEEYAHTTKKVETIPTGARSLSPHGALVQAVSDKADPTRNMSVFSQGYWQAGKEIREAYITSGYCLYPNEYKEYLLTEFDTVGNDPEPACRFASYDQEMFTITDLTGLCNFLSCFLVYPPINTRALIADLISCATGMDLDEAGLTDIAVRTINLVRAINVRFGLKPEDDSVPEMFFKRNPSPPVQMERLYPDKLNKYIQKYYQIRGWSPEGIPTRETLTRYGLDYVCNDFEQRGII
jgi:aldehyde:ferredoxin oxidoreductase